ncbi:protein SPMIP1-like [Centroberyx gerrardi]|uniref:protein SPMIP1-like n=1 Tax=Centroberyx gerrardi TaxID=166262 RepID=UPI003AACB4B2
MDPQMENFWKEAILKENMTRLKWFQHNWSKKTGNNAVQKVGERGMGVKLPKINAHQPERDTKPSTTAASTVPQRKKMEEAAGWEVMRPPSGNTRQVLYEGLSKEETGPHKYLLLRKDKSPEEKYLYPITTNWLYGWGLGDVSKPCVPKHGRHIIVRESFYRKNGIFPSITSNSDTVG